MKVSYEGLTLLRLPVGTVLVGDIFNERRAGTRERARNRGYANIGLGFINRRSMLTPWGRRAGDKEAHAERRVALLTPTGCAMYTLRRRKGDERRWYSAISVDPLWVNPRRRKGEERRDQALQCFSMRNPHARRAQGLPLRRTGDPKDRRQSDHEANVNQRCAAVLGWVNPRRRTGEERRDPNRKYPLLFRRRKSDERRVRNTDWSADRYQQHPDPRVQKMDRRRVSTLTSFWWLE